MTESPQRLIGFWKRTKSPTQETILVLCPEGTGFVFFHRDSLDVTPCLDVFTWSSEKDGEIKVAWETRHTQSASVPHPRKGTTDVATYRWISEEPRSLQIALPDLPSMALTYANAPGDSAQETARLQNHLKEFDRADKEWQPLPATMAAAPKPLIGNVALLGMIAGTLGQALILADPSFGYVTVNERVLLTLPICLCIILRENETTNPMWARWVRIIHLISVIAILILSVVTITMATWTQIDDWLQYSLMTLVGLAAALNVLWKTRKRH